ncbi:MAG: hypothetical protein ACFFBD_25325 [Candidatus Hodarchaeota archaeon]
MKQLREKLGYKGIYFERFTHDSADGSRGTVLIDRRVIPDYPSIKRAYILEKAIKREFESSTFLVEEKVDGTNIRLIYVPHKDLILAFS